MQTRKLFCLILPLTLIIPFGCKSETKKPDTRPLIVSDNPPDKEAKDPLKDNPAGDEQADKDPVPKAKEPSWNLSGQWKRDDGLQFEVTDDGKKVSGRLINLEGSEYDTYAFSLDWKNENVLEGVATWLERGGNKEKPRKTNWRLKATDEKAVAGDIDTLDLDPDTMESIFTNKRDTSFEVEGKKPEPEPQPEPKVDPQPDP